MKNLSKFRRTTEKRPNRKHHRMDRSKLNLNSQVNNNMRNSILRYALLTSILVCINDQVIGQSRAGWTRNSFPSEEHKTGQYIPFGGEMRGQRVNYFGVSPANPHFMLMSGNMAGQGFVSRNGKDFESFGTEAGWCGNTFGFSPHDGTLAFALMGTKVYGGTDDATWGTEHPFGMYRTKDLGKTWTQVLRLPENMPGDNTSINTTPGQEPTGKRGLLVDPSINRSTHVYYASSEKGLVRSISNGDIGTWEVVAFENKSVKTMSAGLSIGDVTRLYLVVSDGYSEAKIKDGQVYYDSGRLYRIDISNDGHMSEPELCLNGLYNITDVETNELGRTGFVIVDASTASLESTGGRALYPFGVKGAVKLGIGNVGLGINVDGASLNKNDDGIVLDANDYADLNSLGALYVNPYNPDHWVIQLGGSLEHSFTWSIDGGSTWNDISRNVATVSGQPSVPDFTSYAIGQHHMRAYSWEMDQESGRGDQGSAVGFMDASTVVWMSSSKDRPVLKSTDFGATAFTFTTGSETKWLNQMNTGAGEQLVGCSFGEYGFALSTDGGSSWQGFTEFSADIMNDIEHIATKDFGKGGAANRAGFAVVFEEGISLDKPQHAIMLASRSGVILDAWQTDDLSTWELTTRGDSNAPQRIYETHKDDQDLVGEAFWVDQYVYLGNFRSKDNGKNFDKLYTAPGGERLVVLEVSSSNGKVAIATPNRNKVSQWTALKMYLTIDGGDTWNELEKPKKEKAIAPSGNETWLAPISFQMYCRNRHSIAIDPRVENDPSTGGDLRILLAGRKGIYEYQDERASGSKWTINSTGLDSSLHFNDMESVPWMGSVQFDPSMSGKVYALQTSDRSSMSDWKNPEINRNCIYEGEGTYKPVYRSTDWGVTWTNFDDEDLPDMLTVSTLHVSKNGYLYVASLNSGYFKFGDLSLSANAISDFANDVFKVYPNPAEQIVHIEIENSINSEVPMIFYNSMGQVFKQYVLQGKRKSIEIHDWPKGIYFVSVLGKSKVKMIIVE